MTDPIQPLPPWADDPGVPWILQPIPEDDEDADEDPDDDGG